MAIQFPPINPGDPEPNDGDQFIDYANQVLYVYDAANNAWTPVGSTTNNLAYQGTLNITEPAPADAELGYMYSVLDGGVADSSFLPVEGEVPQWSLVIKTTDGWALRGDGTVASPFTRTPQGVIQPNVDGDNLSMLSGNYNIDVLPEIKI